MATHELRTQDRDGLARFLGWFSIGLGTAQLVAPRAMCKLVGADGKGNAPWLMRAMGAREFAQGSGILVRARPTGWVWARVVGDALDLAALGMIAAKNRRARTAFAIANVAAISVPDVYEALHLTRKDGEPQSGKRIRQAVTINKPRATVENAWNLEYDATFTEAPGGRGTEVAVEFVDDPTAGDFGVLFNKLSGHDKATRLADELRRFKQLVEVGDIVRSDATPDGHELANHLKQRAAQPQEVSV
jgi:uncharacterized membrane protein